MKIGIGFITYNDSTAKYLPYFWPSLSKAIVNLGGDYETKVWIADNSDGQNNANHLFFAGQKNEAGREFFSTGGNIGFSKAYNQMIDRAIEWGADYFFMLNPDTLPDENILKVLVETMATNPSAAVICPRILRWDFNNKKQTDIIDSDGLFITSEQRFSDLHQGQQRSDEELFRVFGFTGAAALLKIKALQETAFNRPDGRQEYLDELMFMYKEDIDLSYRLFLAGWQTIVNPLALIYHDRTAIPAGESYLRIIKNRRNKGKNIRSWSFLNHWILTVKYNDRSLPLSMRWRIWFYQLASSFYALIFEPYLLAEFKKLWLFRGEIMAKKRQIKRLVSIAELKKIMISQ